jgi:hypothetical protein
VTKKGLGAASGHRSVRCRQFDRAPSRKAREGAHPQFVLVNVQRQTGVILPTLMGPIRPSELEIRVEKFLTTTTLTIRECGFDEFWLRDQIYEDPSIMGLGDLEAISKERTQSKGGRLDLLLKDPDDNSMFEVELQLGDTDETHIIRTIEYWTREKQKWPRRSHTAVLVAENITSRFFEVVHVLSQSVPIVGIQANILQVGETRALHFNKVIDTYEEPEETETPQQTLDETYWIKNHPASLECARWYKELLERLYGDVPTKYFESYISLSVGGVARVWVHNRKNNRATIEVRVREKLQEVVDRLHSDGFSLRTRGEYVTLNVSLEELKTKASTHEWLAASLSPENLLVKPQQRTDPKGMSVFGTAATGNPLALKSDSETP